MKIIETKCPNCGAAMNYDADSKSVSCEFCGSSLIVDDETHQLKIDNAEELGYQFEKGRQRAQAESTEYNTSDQNNQPPVPKRRKTWLWVLGWIFIFPVPLMLILFKKKNMNKLLKIGIIIAAWIVYGLIAIVGMANNNDKPKSVYVNQKETTNATTTVPLTTAIPTTAEPTTVEPTVEKTTEKPTQKPTQKPTEKLTEAAVPIVFTEYTNVVEAGSNAFLTITGAPNTEYDIIVNYSSGVSNAVGLENKTSDNNGVVTWEWEVGTKTKPGKYTISVRGGGTEGTVDFEVVDRK